MTRITLEDLGHCMARLNMGNAWEDPFLQIVSPDSETDTIYRPAQAVHISGRHNLIKLHALLGRALAATQEDAAGGGQ